MDSKNISLTEFVAAEDVAGSTMILKARGRNTLIDCGMEYRDGEENEFLPFKPWTIDDVFATHAHADHIGNFLKFYKPLFGFDMEPDKIPKAYSTITTAELAKMQLSQQASSAFIYNRMVKGKKDRFGNWISYKKGKYKYQDMKDVMGQFVSFDGKKKGIPYHQPIKFAEGMTATFYDAGHIPGSSQILFEIEREGKEPTILLTSFDLGRTDYHISDHPVANIPLVRFPEKNFPKKIDYIVIEATYGDKVHGSLDDSVGILQEAINDAHKNKSKLIIPTFSIMRTQMLWSFFYKLREQEKIPKNFQLYSNSPSAYKVARIMMKHIDEMDEQSQKEFLDKKDNPFFNDGLTHLKKAAEGQILWKPGTVLPGPWAATASSGMSSNGRIVSMLRYAIKDPKNIVLQTGYQARDTRGYLLSQKEKEIPFYEVGAGMIPLKADVRRMGGLSGHADSKEIIEHLKHLHDPAKGEQFKGIYIKHGEKVACHKLKELVIAAGFDPTTVQVMKKGETYDISK